MHHSPSSSGPIPDNSPPTRGFPADRLVPLAYGIGDAVTVSGIGRTTLYGLIASGRLASTKVGARRLIRRDDLLALLTEEAAANGGQS